MKIDDKVVCINNSDRRHEPEIKLELNKIYTIKKFIKAFKETEVYLYEIPFLSWKQSRFITLEEYNKRKHNEAFNNKLKGLLNESD